MSKSVKGVSCHSDQGPGVLVTVVLGLMLGYVLSGDLFLAPMQAIIVSCSIGILWSLIFLQWVTMINEGLALKKYALPEELDLSDREAVSEVAATLNDNRLFPGRMRQVLTAWSARWDIQQVLALADFQSRTARTPGRAATVFGILLALPGVWFQGGTLIAWSAIVALGITLYARQALYAAVDARIQNVLALLPNSLPGTEASAAELAGALEKAVERTLASKMPDPDAMAKAMGGAVEQASKAVVSQVDSMNKAITENHQKLLEKLERTGASSAEQFKAAEMALTAAAAAAGAGLGSGGDQIAEALKAHAAQVGEVSHAISSAVSEALKTHAAQVGDTSDKISTAVTEALKTHAAQVSETTGMVSKATSEALAQQTEKLEQNNGALSKVLDDHAAKLGESTQTLAAQLDKIAGLQVEIDKILHLQETVDGALKGVTATEEFTNTLSSLRTHLEASDKLLKDAAKPRTIRLVESDPQA